MKRSTPLSALIALMLVSGCAVPRQTAQEHSTRSTQGMVVSANKLASRIGRDILASGGNAVDAAVATGLALAVLHPQAGNIGGGGFMVIHRSGMEPVAIDFREKAPAASKPDMFLREDGSYSPERHHRSHLAVGVPGTVAGFFEAHRLFGALPWSELVAPAVTLARDGFPVTERLARSIRGAWDKQLSRYVASVEAFSDDGRFYEAGDRLRQLDLAATLERIQAEGRNGFYQGRTADLIVQEMKRGAGIITRQDLASYEPVVRACTRGTFRGFEIIGMPPPSSGGTCLVTMLNILESFDLRGAGHNTPRYVHLLAEAMRLSFRDRARYLADPDFEAMPLSRLTSKAYARQLQEDMPLTQAGKSSVSDVVEPPESPETTHYSVADESGTGVAVTYTLEYSYGSGIVVPGAGFLLNNEMGDFNAKPGLTDERGLIGTAPNLARPGKRMLSSMSPTLILKNGQVLAVLGSPGGRTIINTVLQVALNLMVFNMDIQTAVEAPRFHHQWLPDRITLEQSMASPALLDALRALGHAVSTRTRQGLAHCIAIDPATGTMSGAADPRDLDAGASGL